MQGNVLYASKVIGTTATKARATTNPKYSRGSNWDALGCIENNPSHRDLLSGLTFHTTRKERREEGTIEANREYWKNESWKEKEREKGLWALARTGRVLCTCAYSVFPHSTLCTRILVPSAWTSEPTIDSKLKNLPQ